MAAPLIPLNVGIPSAEPICVAILTALRSEYAADLAVIEGMYPEPPIDLVGPDPEHGYSFEIVNEYRFVQTWPYVTVFGGSLHNAQANENRAGGWWESDLFIRIFLQNPDPDELTLSLYRYAAAAWLCVVNADDERRLAGATLLLGTESIDVDPGGGIDNERAVQVNFRVRWRV